MEKIIAAFATDEGELSIDRHFGDAEYFKIYEITSTEAVYIKTIENHTEEKKDVHADPEKARNIMQLLKQSGVQVAVSKIFGPNIKRIKKRFVCVLINEERLENSIKVVQNNFDAIVDEWNKADAREHINLRKKS